MMIKAILCEREKQKKGWKEEAAEKRRRQNNSENERERERESQTVLAAVAYQERWFSTRYQFRTLKQVRLSELSEGTEQLTRWEDGVIIYLGRPVPKMFDKSFLTGQNLFFCYHKNKNRSE